ncbi:MAG: 50S ribosomal protein L25/general stress protein Ctc [Pseudomonadota bacterium]
MSEQIQIPAQLRELRGKGASRRLRREGLVPGIVYGGDRDPVMLQVPHQFLSHAIEDDAFYTTILEVAVDDGRRQKVILRDLQRHPFKPLVLHVDFLRISDTEKLTIQVPIHFLNEEASPAGKQSGVVISKQITEVEVSCLPKDLPEALDIDMISLDVGDAVHLSDIALPEGVDIVALANDGEDAIVATAAHVAVESAETSDDAPEAGEVPVAGEEADDAAADDGADGGDES